MNVISNFSSSHFFKSHCRFLVFFVIFLTAVISEMKIFIFKKFKKYFFKMNFLFLCVFHNFLKNFKISQIILSFFLIGDDCNGKNYKMVFWYNKFMWYKCLVKKNLSLVKLNNVLYFFEEK